MSGAAALPLLLFRQTPFPSVGGQYRNGALARRAYRSPFPAPRNLNGFNLLTTKENVMQKRLIRKLAALFVLCAAFTAVVAAPASTIKKGGVFCDEAPIESGCYGLMCCNDWGGCWCA